MTAEVVEAFPDRQLTGERVSFVTDDIVVQRYVEIDGHLKKVLAVVKMRGSDHATDFRTYNITSAGAVMGESLSGYHGITTGSPKPRRRAASRSLNERSHFVTGAGRSACLSAGISRLRRSRSP